MGIKCPKCHFDNPSDSKFCKECGTQITPLEEIPVTETLETPPEAVGARRLTDAFELTFNT